MCIRDSCLTCSEFLRDFSEIVKLREVLECCVGCDRAEAESLQVASPLPYQRRYCIRDRKYGTYSRCCRGVVYDRRKSTCCNGVQKLVPGYTGCCNGLMYSPSSHVCCPDQIVRYKIYGQYTGCCGSELYRYDALVSSIYQCQFDVKQVKKTDMKANGQTAIMV